LQRFDAAIDRFARAVAPIIAYQVRQLADDPDVALSASDLLRGAVGSVVTRFATADGELSAIEARAFERVAGSTGFAEIVERAGSLRSGELYDSIAKLGTQSSFESMTSSGIEMLKVLRGQDEVKEYVLALRSLAAATCNLDGRSEEEGEALRDLDDFLKMALAKTE
jgi:tellurite resistance protein